MTNLHKTMLKEIQLLLSLVHVANKRIEQAEKQEYVLEIGCGGSMGAHGTINALGLNKFSKNLATSSSPNLSPTSLKNSLAKVERELKRLEKLQYCVHLKSRCANGAIRLRIERVHIEIWPSDWRKDTK